MEYLHVQERKKLQVTPSLLLMVGGGFQVLLHFCLAPTLSADGQSVSSCLSGIGWLLLFSGLANYFWKTKGGWHLHILDSAVGFFGITPNRLVALIFSLMFSVTAAITAGNGPQLINPPVSLLSWGASILLIAVAGWEKKPASLLPLAGVIQWIIYLFILSFLLRGMDTTGYPNVLSGDEATSGLYAIGFLKGLTNNIFITGWFSFPSFFSFVQSLGIAIWGQTIPGLRIPSALCGSVTVVVLFLVCRAMFDNRTAFIASLLLAFSHFHIHFSRLGINNIWDGLSWLMTLGALWWAWNKERKAAFTLAGLCLGLSQYFYVSARGLFVVIPLWLICVALQDKKKAARMLPGIILMFLTAAVIILPLACFYFSLPEEFFAPMERVSLTEDWLNATMAASNTSIIGVIWQQFLSSFFGLTVKPLIHWYKPGVALLRPVSAVLFYIGILFMLRKYRDNRLWLIVIWLGFFISSGALSQDTPAAQRYVAAAPACFMVVGYGANKIIQLLEGKLKDHRDLVFGFSIFLVLIVAVNDAWFYFYDYSPKSDFGGYHTQIAQKLAGYLKKQDYSREVVFSGWPEMGFRSIGTLPYLVPEIKSTDFNAPWGDPQNIMPESKKILFVFLPSRQEDLQACMQQYPGGELIEQTQGKTTLYYLYKAQIP
ncbi:MAG: hypothetical protein GYA15_08210 [Leptolinea sp.]|jgi:4-amino-4-deoxy-L-arabinose transferase-like glycosyltransferase|nr:hypothetical protein [Leptolinea sp.]